MFRANSKKNAEKFYRRKRILPKTYKVLMGTLILQIITTVISAVILFIFRYSDSFQDQSITGVNNPDAIYIMATTVVVIFVILKILLVTLEIFTITTHIFMHNNILRLILCILIIICDIFIYLFSIGNIYIYIFQGWKCYVTFFYVFIIYQKVLFPNMKKSIKIRRILIFL